MEEGAWEEFQGKGVTQKQKRAQEKKGSQHSLLVTLGPRSLLFLKSLLKLLGGHIRGKGLKRTSN